MFEIARLDSIIERLSLCKVMLLLCYGTYSRYTYGQKKYVVRIPIIDQSSSVCQQNRESVSSVKLAVKLHLNKFVCRILMSTGIIWILDFSRISTEQTSSLSLDLQAITLVTESLQRWVLSNATELIYKNHYKYLTISSA